MTVQTDRVADDGVTKLLDLEASSKIQILSAPIQLPGVCGLCGTSRTDDRQYIDIGLWFEMYGQFYFCTICMTEMVNRLGGLTAEQADKLNQRLETAEQYILEFQEKEAKIDGVINTLRSTGLFADIDVLSVSPTLDKIIEQKSQGISEQSTGDKQDTIKPDNYAPESVTEQRSNGVPSTPSNELDGWL